MNIVGSYLAGVLDSDGSITISKRKSNKRINYNYCLMIQLTWTKTDTTENFMKNLCIKYGGSYFSGIKGTYKNSKEVIKYCAVGNAAEKIINDTISFLILKTQQAVNGLELRKIVKSFKGSRPIDLTNKLEELYINNKLLNRKNGGYADNK